MEIAVVISVISVVFGVYQGIVNIGRDRNKDNKEEVEKITTFGVVLESIKDDVGEIKKDMKEMKEQNVEILTRLEKVEGSTKRAHERIDVLTDKRKRKRSW